MKIKDLSGWDRAEKGRTLSPFCKRKTPGGKRMQASRAEGGRAHLKMR